jgi:hypothetical protein
MLTGRLMARCAGKMPWKGVQRSNRSNGPSEGQVGIPLSSYAVSLRVRIAAVMKQNAEDTGKE